MLSNKLLPFGLSGLHTTARTPDQSGVPHPHNIFAVLMDIIAPFPYYRASMFSISWLIDTISAQALVSGLVRL